MFRCCFCQEFDHPSRLEYAATSLHFAHRRCAMEAIREPEPSELALQMARELGLMRPAAGRRARECPRGHPYEGDNLILSRQDGGRLVRKCRACQKLREKERKHQLLYQERERRWRGAHKQANWERSHCPNGHEYTEATLLIGPSGNKRCRECQRQAATVARSRQNGFLTPVERQETASGPEGVS